MQFQWWRRWHAIPLLAVLLATIPFIARPAEPAFIPLPPFQLGLASYYGPGFHGHETASGRIFNQTEMVAAHRTLPLGSVVRVTNLTNGRAVTLKVIDRGPYGRNFRKGTIIDVSKGAARRLQFLDDGLVKVSVEILSDANPADSSH